MVTGDKRRGGFADSLAAELKWQIAFAEVTPSEMARRTKESQPSVSNWLNQRNPIPLRFVHTATQVLGARVPDLFNLTELRLQTESPLLISGTLNRERRVTPEPSALHKRGLLFVDCVSVELKSQVLTHGYSVWQIGPAVEYSRTASGQWLNGKKQIPLQFVYDVCTFLEVNVTKLAELTESRMNHLEHMF